MTIVYTRVCLKGLPIAGYVLVVEALLSIRYKKC